MIPFLVERNEEMEYIKFSMPRDAVDVGLGWLAGFLVYSLRFAKAI